MPSQCTVEPGAVAKFWSNVRKTDDCWVWTLKLTRNKVGEMLYLGKRWRVPRLAYTLFFGSIPANRRVYQRCDNLACVRPEHLILGPLRRKSTLATSEERFWACVDRTEGCWLWKKAVKGSGYGAFDIAGRQEVAHRVAWTYTFGAIPDGMFVLHRCDVPACCNPSHLFLGTAADNTHDMHAKNRAHITQGESSPFVKLTAEQVREIRARYSSHDETCRNIAKEFGITRHNVSYIGRRLTWKGLP